MKLTNNFSKMEFDSRDGAIMPADILDNVKQLAENLQKIRDFLGQPIHINSGYRSANHNKAVGGKTSSQHLIGKAADIAMKNFTAKDLSIVIEKMINNGEIKQGGVGLYNGFLHYDIRGQKQRWNNSTKYKDFWI